MQILRAALNTRGFSEKIFTEKATVVLETGKVPVSQGWVILVKNAKPKP